MDAEYVHTRTYARECIIARRMVERSVRFIELTIPMVDGFSRWDAHGNLVKNHGDNARAVDQPIAGLLADLKARGLLDSTLVVFAGEFGRTPFAQNQAGQGFKGRDHFGRAYSWWLAGGGVKGGHVHGATDDFGWNITKDAVHIHDMQATLMHLFGINHEGLLFRYQGRQFRLTDVHGHVVKGILKHA